MVIYRVMRAHINLEIEETLRCTDYRVAMDREKRAHNTKGIVNIEEDFKDGIVIRGKYTYVLIGKGEIVLETKNEEAAINLVDKLRNVDIVYKKIFVEKLSELKNAIDDELGCDGLYREFVKENSHCYYIDTLK